jgi:hypothetical protein
VNLTSKKDTFFPIHPKWDIWAKYNGQLVRFDLSRSRSRSHLIVRLGRIFPELRRAPAKHLNRGRTDPSHLFPRATQHVRPRITEQIGRDTELNNPGQSLAFPSRYRIMSMRADLRSPASKHPSCVSSDGQPPLPQSNLLAQLHPRRGQGRHQPEVSPLWYGVSIPRRLRAEPADTEPKAGGPGWIFSEAATSASTGPALDPCSARAPAGAPRQTAVRCTAISSRRTGGGRCLPGGSPRPGCGNLASGGG